jgi:hypothetical protein
MAIALFPHGGYPDRGYPFGFLHDRVLQIGAEKGVPCIDLRRDLTARLQQGEPNKLIVNRFDGHPSALANRLAADALLARFSDTWISGMIRKRSPRPPS